MTKLLDSFCENTSVGEQHHEQSIENNDTNEWKNQLSSSLSQSFAKSSLFSSPISSHPPLVSRSTDGRTGSFQRTVGQSHSHSASASLTSTPFSSYSLFSAPTRQLNFSAPTSPQINSFHYVEPVSFVHEDWKPRLQPMKELPTLFNNFPSPKNSTTTTIIHNPFLRAASFDETKGRREHKEEVEDINHQVQQPFKIIVSLAQLVDGNSANDVSSTLDHDQLDSEASESSDTSDSESSEEDEPSEDDAEAEELAQPVIKDQPVINLTYVAEPITIQSNNSASMHPTTSHTFDLTCLSVAFMLAGLTSIFDLPFHWSFLLRSLTAVVTFLVVCYRFPRATSSSCSLVAPYSPASSYSSISPSSCSQSSPYLTVRRDEETLKLLSSVKINNRTIVKSKGGNINKQQTNRNKLLAH